MNRFQSLTDAQLVQNHRQGDREASGALIHRYERSILGKAFRLTGDTDDAEDVAAETRFRIFRAMDKIRDATTLHYWINRIITNVFYEKCRRSRRCPTVSLDACVANSGDMLLTDEYSTVVSMESHTEAVERLGILNKGINALPASQRLLISLFHLQDRSYQEIATDLRIPIGTVKSRLSRARVGLRAQLEPQRAMLTT